MIKIEKAEVFGWEAAIRGMRNPMNSWSNSDTVYNVPTCEDCSHTEDDCCKIYDCMVLGANDLKLMQNFSKAGNDPGEFLRYLVVQLDITAPFYWWREFKTYRKGRKFMDDGDEFLDPEEFEMHIETNSCSTMHKIYAKEFTLDDFSHEHIDDTNLLWCIPDELNKWRELYLETKEKKYWWQMIQLLPSSYNQRRTVQLNYQVLKSMYHARKNHKLNEWREFCEWMERLPYFKEICVEV